jgi:hypothetical protein
MPPIITAFERSPDGGGALARDTRVRWAPEEVGRAYEVRMVSSRSIGRSQRRWQARRKSAASSDPYPHRDPWDPGVAG